MKFLTNITPRFRADFAGLVLTMKSSIGNIEKYFNQTIDQSNSIAPISPATFVLDREEFSFIWVQY